MDIFKRDSNFDFTGKRKIAFIFSCLLILSSLSLLIVNKGPKYGIDFSGGTLIQIKFSAPILIKDLKKSLIKIGIDKPSVQAFGEKEDNEYLIRVKELDFMGEHVAKLLSEKLDKETKITSKIRRVEMVGPQVGKDLREKALFAMFYALLFITIYISGRFEMKWALSGVVTALLVSLVYVLSLFNLSIPFLIFAALILSLILFGFLRLKYAMGAIVALIHDVLITVGVFSFCGLEFTLPIIAALLTIIGYSLNDTIIVYDRIRENLNKKSGKAPLGSIINTSINETLNRTVLTSSTTLIVVLILYLFGGGIIQDFAFTLLIGILIGTYSSIFVASPILMMWKE